MCFGVPSPETYCWECRSSTLPPNCRIENNDPNPFGVLFPFLFGFYIFELGFFLKSCWFLGKILTFFLYYGLYLSPPTFPLVSVPQVSLLLFPLLARLCRVAKVVQKERFPIGFFGWVLPRFWSVIHFLPSQMFFQFFPFSTSENWSFSPSWRTLFRFYYAQSARFSDHGPPPFFSQAYPNARGDQCWAVRSSPLRPHLLVVPNPSPPPLLFFCVVSSLISFPPPSRLGRPLAVHGVLDGKHTPPPRNTLMFFAFCPVQMVFLGAPVFFLDLCPGDNLKSRAIFLWWRDFFSHATDRSAFGQHLYPFLPLLLRFW